MAGVRRMSAGALVLVMTGLAMLAWWSMLAAERSALASAEASARQAATIAAVTMGGRSAEEIAPLVEVAEDASGVRLLVQGPGGEALFGNADPSAPRRSVDVPGTNLTVSAEVDGDAGLGLGRYSKVVSALAFVVMALAVGLLRLVARDRKQAEAEVERLGQRWNEVAAADDLTGLGNRQRLLEDAKALIARGTRYGNSFGLALFEIEGDPSDALVVAVADTISGEARGGDLCYRLSGGRFVSLLPEQDETGAALAADRIRRVLAARFGDRAIRTGASSFSPWVPSTAADLLLRAEVDLGSASLLSDV